MTDQELYQQYLKEKNSQKPSDQELYQQYLAEKNAVRSPQGTNDQAYNSNQAAQDLVTGTRAVASGLSAGITEPISAALYAPIGAAKAAYQENENRGLANALTEAAMAALSPDQLKQQYESYLQSYQQTPVTQGIEIASSLLPGSLPGKIAGMATKAAPTILPEVLSKAPGIAQKVVTGATESALAGVGEQAIRSTGQLLKGESPQLSDITSTGLISAGIGGGIPLAGGVVRGIAKAPKKLLATFSTVPEETINKYIENFDRINQAPSKESVIQEIDDFVGKMVNDVDNKKLTTDQAKQLLKNAEEQAGWAFQDIKGNIKQGLDQKREAWKLSLDTSLEGLKRQKNISSISEDVQTSIGQLKQKVTDNSQRSYDVLDRYAAEGMTIPKDDILNAIDSEVNKFKIGGQVVSESEENAVKRLKRLHGKIKNISSETKQIQDQILGSELSNLASEVSSSEAGKRIFYDQNGVMQQAVTSQSSTFPQWFRDMGFKSKQEFLNVVKSGKGEKFNKVKDFALNKILSSDVYDEATKNIMSASSDHLDLGQVKGVLRSLDSDITYLVNRNDFNNAFNGAASRVRGKIDANLKVIPEYRAIMEETAKNAKLLSEANKKFKDIGSTQTILKNITQKGENAALLEQIGKNTGNDFTKQINKAKQAEAVLTTPEAVKNLKYSLPEAGEVSKLKRKLDDLNARARKSYIQNATTKEQKAVNSAIDSYKQANDKLREISQVKKGSRNSVETFVSSAKDKNFELMQRLSKLTGKDYTTTLKDIGVREAFTKEATRGSRNVNLWGAIAGGVLGSKAGPLGIPIGAVLGAMNDKYGPKVAKVLIDNAVKIGKNPTVEKINKLVTDPEIRDILTKELTMLGRQTAIKR